MTKRLSLIRSASIAALCSAAALSACKTEQKAQPPGPAAAMAPKPNQVTVHAKDFAFSGPDTVPAGVTEITLVNDGPGIHHLQLVKLDSGKTAGDFEAAMKANKWPMWAYPASGPNAPMPNASATATVDLAAGTYLMICVIDVPDHVSHLMKGMTKPLVVTPNSAPLALMPKADITLSATEYTYAISDTIRPGMRTFEVKLAGAQPHEVVLVRLSPGKTVNDFNAWGATYKGPPPGEALGGVSETMPGNTVQFTANVTPGNYLLVCFISDAKDHRPHIMHGMVVPFTVS